MDYRHLRVERTSPAIATVTLDRPAKANALHYEHLAEIEAAALAFREESEIRVVIFTGAGAHFSSGADLTDDGNAYRAPLVQRRRRLRIGERCIRALTEMDQITIAAWNGAAMGGGACIATALDFRIGADDCFMQYPEIDIGVNLMWRSLPLLVRLVGAARAKRLVIGGERIQAKTLLAWGVLDERAPRDGLLDAAEAMAERYAAKPPIAAQMIKQSVNQIAGALDAAIMHMDADQNLLAAGSDDRRAAIESYLAKTTPTFTGN
ncbi:MAG: enoyl-CoA hydratase/isomerase family protein [Gammaproteobacteria bacterium]|nr:enoyl-CoA hydratase/isomerase family protein [Gammaproteobacteria bacterium]